MGHEVSACQRAKPIEDKVSISIDLARRVAIEHRVVVDRITIGVQAVGERIVRVTTLLVFVIV